MYVVVLLLLKIEKLTQQGHVIVTCMLLLLQIEKVTQQGHVIVTCMLLMFVDVTD